MTDSGTRRKVIIDTDTGIDDAHAILYLAGHPDAEIVAVTTVYGNCEIDDAVRNAARTLEVAGLSTVPLARGAAGPLEGEPRYAWYVHGRDGLGDLGLGLSGRDVVAESSADYLVTLANSAPGEYDLLPLGPLTNLALALERDPLVLTKFRSVVMMGGSGPYAPPGTMLMIDANVQNDSAAAAAVFAAPRRLMMTVGVNVTQNTILDEQAIQALRAAGTPWSEFSVSILDSYLDFYQHEWGRRVTPVHDGLAAAIIVEPDLVTAYIDGPVNVLSNGYQTRGRLMMTSDGYPPAFDFTPAPPTRAVTDVDRPRFLRKFVDILSNRPPAKQAGNG